MRYLPVFLLVASLPAVLAAQASPKAYLANTYAAMAARQKAKDVAGMTALFQKVATPDFRYYLATGGYVGRNAMLEQMRNQAILRSKVDAIAYKVTGLQQKGKVATASVTSVFAITAPSRDGKVHHASAVNKTQDTWVYVGGQWKLKRIKVLSEKSLFDGQPIQMKR